MVGQLFGQFFIVFGQFFHKNIWSPCKASTIVTAGNPGYGRVSQLQAFLPLKYSGWPDWAKFCHLGDFLRHWAKCFSRKNPMIWAKF
jgi:hypothetical protein